MLTPTSAAAPLTRRPLASGGDTRIVGANVDVHRVIARVGGDLNLESMQDTSQSAARQSSLGGGFNASLGGVSASLDQQTAEASGGKHDDEIRSIVGCQNLNCAGYKRDPQYRARAAQTMVAKSTIVCTRKLVA